MDNKMYIGIGALLVLLIILAWVYFTKEEEPLPTNNIRVRSIILTCYPGNTECSTVKTLWEDAVKKISADPKGKSISLRINEPTTMPVDDPIGTNLQYSILFILTNGQSVRYNPKLASASDVILLVEAALADY